MHTQPAAARASDMLNGDLIEEDTLCKYFTKDPQREEAANWDLRQRATSVTIRNKVNQGEYYTDLDASLGLNVYTDYQQYSHLKRESRYGSPEQSLSPSSSSLTHSSESNDPAPLRFRSRENKSSKWFISAKSRVPSLELPRRGRPHHQQVITGPKMKALKRKRDVYEEDQSSDYCDIDAWTTACPSSSESEISTSQTSDSGPESSYSVIPNKRQRSSTFLQPARNYPSQSETRLPSIKNMIKSYERVDYDEPMDVCSFHWSWLMLDRDVVESLSIGL